MPRFVSILYMLVLIAGLAISGDSWEQAAILERSGDPEGALVLYDDWLEKNPRSPGSGDVLLHAASIFENVRDAIDLLRKHAGQVDKPHPAWAALAGLESAIGLPVEAAEHYRMASEPGGASAERWLLSSLVLRYSAGDYVAVHREAGKMSVTAESAILRDEAASISALALAAMETPEAAVKELDAYITRSATISTPVVWLALLNISRTANDQFQVRRAETSLEAGFPDSAVHYLSSSRILWWTSPGDYINVPAVTGLTWVQAGAFASRESAASLRYRLENAGFTSWLEQNGDLWRVLVNDTDGGVRDRLAAKGFSGLF